MKAYYIKSGKCVDITEDLIVIGGTLAVLTMGIISVLAVETTKIVLSNIEMLKITTIMSLRL